VHGVRVTCDKGYRGANFNLPRPHCSRVRPDVRDRQTDVRRQTDRRQTDVRQKHRLMPPPCGSGGIIIMLIKLSQYGIKGSLLEWIWDFLTGRSHQTRVNGVLSCVADIVSGVVQGIAASVRYYFYYMLMIWLIYSLML